MANWNTGVKNGNWKGGRSVASNGYVLVRVGTDHHLSDVRGYAYEHRLVVEQKLGRRLKKGEIVHHIDGNKTNNDLANLEVCESIGHHLHDEHGNPDHRAPGEANLMSECACGCSGEFPKYDRWGRPRRYINGHNARKIRHG